MLQIKVTKHTATFAFHLWFLFLHVRWYFKKTFPSYNCFIYFWWSYLERKKFTMLRNNSFVFGKICLSMNIIKTAWKCALAKFRNAAKQFKIKGNYLSVYNDMWLYVFMFCLYQVLKCVSHLSQKCDETIKRKSTLS